MPDNSRIAELFLKKLKNNLAGKESDELEGILHSSEKYQRVFAEISNPVVLQEAVRKIYSFSNEDGWEKLKANIPFSGLPGSPARIISVRKYLIAGIAVSVLFATSLYFYSLLKEDKPSKQVVNNTIPANEPGKTVPAGNYAAVLELADGRVIDLNNTPDGELFRQGNIIVSKKGREIQYSQVTGHNDNEDNYNTMRMQSGQQYKLTLSDHSTILINGSSAVRYPFIFSGEQKKVQVSGETYFEVQQTESAVTGKSIPFLVTVKENIDDTSPPEVNREIEILGTQFTINAYNINRIITTLLTGELKVSAYNGSHTKLYNSRTLRPGQQATLLQNKKIIVQKADTSKATAWKKGLFNFKGDDLETIFSELERWYGVDIDFRGTLPAVELGGKFNRNEPISKILDLLEKKYKWEINPKGKTYIITPQ